MEKPTFLKGVPRIPAAERDKILEQLANWTKVQEALKEWAYDDELIKKAIWIEATTRRRMAILLRLKSRLNTIKRDHEWEELLKYAAATRTEDGEPAQ